MNNGEGESEKICNTRKSYKIKQEKKCYLSCRVF